MTEKNNLLASIPTLHRPKKHNLMMMIVNLVVVLILFRLILNHFVSFDQFVELAKNFYAVHGNAVLLVSGFLESLIVVGWYYPGSTIILLGAALAGLGSISIVNVILLTSLGLIIGYAINFYIGRRFGQKVIDTLELSETVKPFQKQTKQSLLVYFLSAIHPNIAAVAALTLGVSRERFGRFLLLLGISQLIWSSIWGGIFFFFGMLVLRQVVIVTAVVFGCYVIYLAVSKIVSVQKTRRPL